MFSPFIGDLGGIPGGGLGSVVRWRGNPGALPLGEDGEEAGDVLDDLPSLLAAQITPKAWLPYLASSVDQIVVCGVPWFHRRLHGRLWGVPCLWPPVSEIPPITRGLILICISGVPIAGIATFVRASARQFFLGYVELVGLAFADD